VRPSGGSVMQQPRLQRSTQQALQERCDWSPDSKSKEGKSNSETSRGSF
jgi:hypothetical protein